MSHIDPLGRVKCNVVYRVTAAHKGRDAHVVAAECTYMLSAPSYRPPRPRKGWKASIDRSRLDRHPPTDVNTCSRRYSHGRIDFLTRLLRVINPTRVDAVLDSG